MSEVDPGGPQDSDLGGGQYHILYCSKPVPSAGKQQWEKDARSGLSRMGIVQATTFKAKCSPSRSPYQQRQNAISSPDVPKKPWHGLKQKAKYQDDPSEPEAAKPPTNCTPKNLSSALCSTKAARSGKQPCNYTPLVTPSEDTTITS